MHASLAPALLAAALAAGATLVADDVPPFPEWPDDAATAALGPAETMVEVEATEVLGPTGELVQFRAAIGPVDFPLLPVEPGIEIVGVIAPPLPDAPGEVVRQTRYFGTVTVDHRAHLERRITCTACHGEGRVTALVFTPKVAHGRCIGCHQQVAKGPDTCSGCHVRPAPPPEQLEAAAVQEPPKPPAPNPENVAAALAAFDATPRAHRQPEPFQRHVEFGIAAGRGGGLSIRLSSHQDWIVFTQSIEQLRGSDAARTLALLGVGVTRPANRATSVETSAVVGLDVFDRPVVAVFPAVGARVAVEWRQPTPFLQNFTTSLTCVTDTSRRAFGRDVGGVAVYGVVSTGFRVP